MCIDIKKLLEKFETIWTKIEEHKIRIRAATEQHMVIKFMLIFAI